MDVDLILNEQWSKEKTILSNYIINESHMWDYDEWRDEINLIYHDIEKNENINLLTYDKNRRKITIWNGDSGSSKEIRSVKSVMNSILEVDYKNMISNIDVNAHYNVLLDFIQDNGSFYSNDKDYWNEKVKEITTEETLNYWDGTGKYQEIADKFDLISPKTGKFNLNIDKEALDRLNELIDLVNVYYDYNNNALANTIKLPDRDHYEDWYGGYINEFGEEEEEPTMTWDEFQEENLEVIDYDSLDILYKVKDLIEDKGIEAGGDLFIPEIEYLFEEEMNRLYEENKNLINNIHFELQSANEHVKNALENLVEDTGNYDVSGTVRFNLLCYNAYNLKSEKAIEYLKEIENSELLSNGYSHMINMNIEDIDYGIITHLRVTNNKLGVNEIYKLNAHRVKEFFEYYPNIEDETKIKLMRIPGIEKAAMVRDMSAEEVLILLEVANQEENFRLYAENLKEIDTNYYPIILDIFEDSDKYNVTSMAVKMLNGSEFSKLEVEFNSYSEIKDIQNSDTKEVDEQLNTIVQLQIETYDQSREIFLQNIITNYNKELWELVRENRQIEESSLTLIQELQDELIYNKFEDYLVANGEERTGLSLLEEDFPNVDVTQVVLKKMKEYTTKSYTNFHNEKLSYIMGNKINYVKQDTEDIEIYVDSSSDKAYDTYLSLKEEEFINSTHMYCEEYTDQLNKIGKEFTGASGLTGFDTLDIYKEYGSERPIEIIISCLDEIMNDFSTNDNFDIVDKLGLSQVVNEFSKRNQVELSEYNEYKNLLKSIFKDEIEDIISHDNSSYSRDLYEFNSIKDTFIKELIPQLYECVEEIYSAMGIIVKGEDVISYEYYGEELNLNLNFEYKLINENVCIASLNETSNVTEFEFIDHFNWVFEELGEEKYFKDIYMKYKERFITTEISNGDWKELSYVNGIGKQVFVNDEKDNMYLYVQKGILDEVDGTIDEVETIEVYAYDNRNDMKTDFASLTFENANLKIGKSYVKDYLNEDINESLKILCKNQDLKGYLANNYRLDSYLQSMYDIQFKSQNEKISLKDIQNLNDFDMKLVSDVSKLNKLDIDKDVLAQYGEYFKSNVPRDYIANDIQHKNGDVFIKYFEYNDIEKRYDQYIAKCSEADYELIQNDITENDKWNKLLNNSDILFDNEIFDVEDIDQSEDSLSRLTKSSNEEKLER